MSYIRTGRRDYSEAYRPGFKPRNKTLSLMVSDDEATEVDDHAAKSGVKRSAWLTRIVTAELKRLRDLKAKETPATKKVAKKAKGATSGSAPETHGSQPGEVGNRPTQPCAICKGTGKTRGFPKIGDKKAKELECHYCGGCGWVYKLSPG